MTYDRNQKYVIIILSALLDFIESSIYRLAIDLPLKRLANDLNYIYQTLQLVRTSFISSFYDYPKKFLIGSTQNGTNMVAVKRITPYDDERCFKMNVNV